MTTCWWWWLTTRTRPGGGGCTSGMVTKVAPSVTDALARPAQEDDTRLRCSQAAEGYKGNCKNCVAEWRDCGVSAHKARQLPPSPDLRSWRHLARFAAARAHWSVRRTWRRGGSRHHPLSVGAFGASCPGRKTSTNPRLRHCAQAQCRPKSQSLLLYGELGLIFLTS
jgi:hypothetical protein